MRVREADLPLDLVADNAGTAKQSTTNRARRRGREARGAIASRGASCRRAHTHTGTHSHGCRASWWERAKGGTGAHLGDENFYERGDVSTSFVSFVNPAPANGASSPA